MLITGVSIGERIVRKETKVPETCEECEYFEECITGKRKVCAFRESSTKIQPRALLQK